MIMVFFLVLFVSPLPRRPQSDNGAKIENDNRAAMAGFKEEYVFMLVDPLS